LWIEANAAAKHVAAATVDPDATNALPVLRASDRPLAGFSPSAAGQPSLEGVSRSGSIPPGATPPSAASGATGPSWHTPNTSYASITVSAPRPRRTAWIAVGAVALVVTALGAGVGLGWRSRGNGNTARSEAAAKANAAPPAVTAFPAPSASAEPPSISVDSLPGAGGAASPAGSAKLGSVHGTGRLLVTASPGACQLAIDGKAFGSTPVAGIDLPLGPHQLRCETATGKVRATSVTIQEGASLRIKLALDE